ncbi:hypothetical protein RJ639_004052 [Escallonia herrerae]|uniref:Retrovirus-related Pol polyprotein from transposon RE1 n=1 Tax=Escallonia herrerae TaxID=1293975 RepID=A0AA89AWA7_9ASTE|nr:hypothetical protein RJ639_004052 [Escallonia herrerae]
MDQDDGKDTIQRKTISPYDLTTNDNPGIIITQVQLKGENYDEWARLIRTALRARKKFGFIDGTIKRSDENSSDLEDWWTINSLLVSWIRNTIEPTLRSSISHVEGRISRMLIGARERRDGLYYFRAIPSIKAMKVNGACSLDLWYKRLGHPSLQVTKLNPVVDLKKSSGYLINRTPSSILNGKTPFEIIYGQAPEYEHLRVLGSLCFAHIQGKTRDKFSSRSHRCIFVGYPYGKKGWRLYDLETKEFFVSRDLDFYETEFPCAILENGTTNDIMGQSLLDYVVDEEFWIDGDLVDGGVLGMSMEDMSIISGVVKMHRMFRSNLGVQVNVLVYVDDLIISGNNHAAIQRFKTYLSECFHMKDLGVLKYFLGVEVARGPEGIFLCQSKYALDMISEIGLLGVKLASVPLEQNHQLALATGPLIDDPERYHRLVGRLIYLCFTRLELSYCVHVLSQFMQQLREEQWEAALRVVRYLKGNPGQVSRSSAEAEYRSMAMTTGELLWLKGILRSLGVSHNFAMHLSCNSQADLHIAKNPVFHKQTKHIEVDCRFVRDEIIKYNIHPQFVPSQTQLADIFTKALGESQFDHFTHKLGIHNLHAPT